MQEIEIDELLEWILVVFVTGVIAGFGKPLAQRIIQGRRRRPAPYAAGPGPDTGSVRAEAEIAMAEEAARAARKADKAEAKAARRGASGAPRSALEGRSRGAGSRPAGRARAFGCRIQVEW
ncbi:MAG: hypothetical protein GF330_14740 [Candidatus Eisenbacteria bacterium]|nr:hypothetical protein [Candidatus Eisenbacteria bacterium]